MNNRTLIACKLQLNHYRLVIDIESSAFKQTKINRFIESSEGPMSTESDHGSLSIIQRRKRGNARLNKINVKHCQLHMTQKMRSAMTPICVRSAKHGI